MNPKEQDFFSTNIKLFETIYDSFLIGHIDKDVFLTALQAICDEFELSCQKLSKSFNETLSGSKLGTIMKVYQRLQLISTLENDPGNNSLEFKGYAFPGLITYLLLTCFDLLGQKDSSWKFFPDWLKSKKCTQEVEAARLKIINNCGVSNENEINHMKFSELLFNEYQIQYGNKNAFSNFINSVLPQGYQEELLECIKIEKIIEVDEKTTEIQNLDDLEKIKWLYNLRNSYTHNLHTSEKNYKEGVISSQGNLIIWDQIIRSDSTTTFFVTDDFKNQLKQAVIAGLVQVIVPNPQIEMVTNKKGS